MSERSATGRPLGAEPPFSFRADPAVPAFPDDHPLIVFDGQCVLCSGLARFVARFVARRDQARRIRFTAAQSALGQALMRHYRLDPVNFETNLFIANGRACGRMEALIAILADLGWPWRAARIALLLPQALRDWIYDVIARNRFALFERRQVCIRPDADWRERVID